MREGGLRLKRRRHRDEENKKFILNAAEKIFAKKGYSLATMDEIAEEAQFSKATLYRYFKNKREIFLEIIIKSFEEMYHKLTKIALKKINAEEKLRELIRSVGSYYYKKRNITRIFFIEKSMMMKILNIDPEKQIPDSSHRPKFSYEFKNQMEKIFNIMCEVIKEGIKSGEFRKVDVKEAGFILGTMIRGFHFRSPMDYSDYSISESTDLLLGYFLYGIKKDRKVRRGE